MHGAALCGLLLGIGSSIVASQDHPTDYPQWRGKARDGSASAFEAPTRWPETLTRRWTVDVGAGYGTPLVIGETVYTFTRKDGNEVATALEAATGVVVWETAYPAPYDVFSGAARHGEGPKATPLFHDGRLYTHGVTGALSAFDGATGELVWQIPAPDGQPLFGTAVSPLTDGNRVIVHRGYEPLTAFDALTGEVAWTSGDQGLWASPIITELDGVRQVVSVAYQVVEGIEVDDGGLLWDYPIDPRVDDKIRLNGTLEIVRTELARSHKHPDQPRGHRRANIRDDVVADHRGAAGWLTKSLNQRLEEDWLRLPENQRASTCSVL